MEFWILGFLLIFSLSLQTTFFFLIFGYPFLYECLVYEKMGQAKRDKKKMNVISFWLLRKLKKNA